MKGRLVLHLTINTDGAARGNPGPAAIGVVIKDDSGKTLWRLGRPLGRATNNVAEYEALIAGLEKARDLGAATVTVHADSELVIRQMGGTYKVKSPNMKPLHARAKALADGFESCELRHVAREDNSEADALANEALDGGA